MLSRFHRNVSDGRIQISEARHYSTLDISERIQDSTLLLQTTNRKWYVGRVKIILCKYRVVLFS